MAKVTPGAKLPGKPQSLRGCVYYRVDRGVLVACKWPHPRGKPKTPQHRQQVAWFTQAQKLASRVDAKTQITIRQAFARSPLMPRDVATSLMAGRMYALRGADNLYIRSKRAMSEVSKALDVVSNIPGQTLIRGPEFWQGQVPITEAGRWIWPSPEVAWTGPLASANFSWKGSVVVPGAAIVVSQIGAILELVAGGEYQAAVATLDAQRFVTVWQPTSVNVAAASGRQMVRWDLDTVLSPLTRYALMVGRKDTPDGHPLPTVPLTNGSYPWPGERSEFAAIFEAQPGAGSDVAGVGFGVQSVGVLATF